MTSDTADEPLVLIVEDHPANLMLVRAVLQRAGFRTAEARSAEEALDLIAASPPAIVLTDVQLPGLDGLEMTRRLKADPATAAIPVVALTAFAMKDDQSRALAAGCDGYIAKPFDTRRLGDEVAAILRLARNGVSEGG